MNRITYFSIKNFRCFHSIAVELPVVSPLTFLIGLNGSGKTTFLQSLGFVGALMRGDIEEWLRIRGWTLASLPTKPSLQRKSLIDIEVRGQIDITQKNSTKDFFWTASFNTSQTLARCTSEKLILSDSSSGETVEAIKVVDGNSEQSSHSLYMISTAGFHILKRLIWKKEKKHYVLLKILESLYIKKMEVIPLNILNVQL